MKKLECILLVDDDEVANFLNLRLLQKAGVADEIAVVQHGRQALEFIEARAAANSVCPELIFLDVKMPVMDGFEFLKHYFGEEAPRLASAPVVMLSSSINPKDVTRAMEGGATLFLDKPLSVEKIERVWQSLLN